MSDPAESKLVKMTRAEAFTHLRSLGAVKATIQFGGGGDEGGITGIELINASDEEFRHIDDVYDGTNYRMKTADDRLAAALASPVYDRYTSFDGGEYIEGVVTWHVPDERVMLDVQIQEWVEYPSEEI